MDSLWSGLAPWLALAGLGALHGLNPASGWLLAALCTARSPQRAAALRALGPIALGHAASVALVAALVALGFGPDGRWLQGLAAGALLVLVGRHARHWRQARQGRQGRQGGRPGWQGPPARGAAAGLALSAFIAATAQGAGLMLVPALVPLCLSGSPARALTASGSLALSLAAVAVHLGAMLVVTALLAIGGRHGLARLAKAQTGR